jgi:shikimate dehydrogenase
MMVSIAERADPPSESAAFHAAPQQGEGRRLTATARLADKGGHEAEGRGEMPFSGAVRLAGVMGWPVRHSLSPRLHMHWFERCGVDGAYVPLAVAPGDVGLAFEALPRLGFLGWNVTIPHKEEAFRRVDRHDPAASRMQAVNTVLVQADGSLLGCNTDGLGFMANLRAQAPSWRPEAGPAVILGTGGAARAVAVALLEAGVPGLRLANRTAEKAQALARSLRELASVPVETVPWAERSEALRGAGLCVNGTSLGMEGHPPLEIALALLPRTAPVADLVYVPLETPLLLAAKQLGHPVVDGLGMLIRQAVPGFMHWGGVAPEVDAATYRLLQSLLARGR